MLQKTLHAFMRKILMISPGWKPTGLFRKCFFGSSLVQPRTSLNARCLTATLLQMLINPQDHSLTSLCPRIPFLSAASSHSSRYAFLPSVTAQTYVLVSLSFSFSCWPFLHLAATPSRTPSLLWPAAVSFPHVGFILVTSSLQSMLPQLVDFFTCHRNPSTPWVQAFSDFVQAIKPVHSLTCSSLPPSNTCKHSK